MTAPLQPPLETPLQAPAPAAPSRPRRRWFGPLNPPIRDWAHKRVWIVGASTGIGQALARALLDQGAQVVLSARRAEPLQRAAAGHPRAWALPVDATDATAIAAAADTVLARWGRLDLVVWMAGGYEAMQADTIDLAAARRLIEVNLMAPIGGLATLVPRLLAQRHGAIALVGSVAGYRGLPKALVYGPTKAGLINLAESLYLDLSPANIGVHLINPGFVATPLTAGNDFPMPSLLTPAQAADAIIAGLERGAFEMHFPVRFTGWLKVGRLLPYRWYFRLAGHVTGARGKPAQAR